MKIKSFQLLKSLISFLLIIIIMIFLYFSYNNTTIEITNTSAFSKITDKLEFQKQIDEKLQVELKSGNYTFENPLVVLNPYNESPLTALLLFTTEQPSKITISISDNNNSEAITSAHKFEKISTEHIIPVYGLFPNTSNHIIINQFSESHVFLGKKDIEIQTEALPSWLDDLIILTESYSDNYLNGLNYHLNYKYAFDQNGTIRWFLSKDYSLSGTYLDYSNNHFIFPLYHNDKVGTIIGEVDKLGKIYNLYHAPFTPHHDIATLPNGNLIVLGNKGETIMDFIYEIDASSGKITNTMDLKYILQRTRLILGLPNWLHANSITYDKSDGTIILSSNNQSTVAKIKWPTGEIKWLLADPIAYDPRFEKYLLQPIGDNFEYSYNQHDVNILPDYDNNPDTIDISLFDNGIARVNIDKTNKYSRLVHYRINEKNMTVEQIWQYGKERRNELYSRNQSSFKMLPNENRLGLFCVTLTDDPNIVTERLVEVDKNSNLIWDAEIFSKSATGSVSGYQVYRLPFYSQNETEHNINIIAKNMLPE